MAIDKIVLMTVRKPAPEYFDRINADYAQDSDSRRFVYEFRFRDRMNVEKIDEYTQVSFWTKPGIVPFVRIWLNFTILGAKAAPATRIETNPNNFDNGHAGLCGLIREIFGDDCPDLRVTRLDKNADIEDVAVQYLHMTLVIPNKRKSGEVSEWKNKGVETFYVGKNPARLRVYDKISELKYRGDDVSRFPQVLTRVEYELHGDRILKCIGAPDYYGTERPAPVLGKPRTQSFYFSELSILKKCRPFRPLRFIEGTKHYDFRNDARGSVRMVTYDAMAKLLGAHDAKRVLNLDRNFARNFREIVLDNDRVHDRIETSFRTSTERYFQNQGASVFHIYCHCASCNLHGSDVYPCEGCGVRLCFGCMALNDGHNTGCPDRD